jgi:hypothetical protein
MVVTVSTGAMTRKDLVALDPGRYVAAMFGPHE